MKTRLIINFEVGKYYETENIKDLTFKLNSCHASFSIESINELISSKTYEPEHKNKLFIAKHCNIPRVKVKNLTEKNKIKVTTKLDNADAIFISKNYLTKMTSSIYNMYEYDGQTFKKLLSYLRKENLITKDDYEMIIIENNSFDLNNDKIPESILVDYRTSSFIESLNLSLEPSSQVKSIKSNLTHILTNNGYEYTKSLISSNKPIYFETDLMVHLNAEDAITIEEDTYETLDEMLSSSDNDNTTLAMEIMANADFKKSLPYLLVLLFKYSRKMDYNPTKKHVNFKSLISLIPSGLNYHIHPYELINYLKQYNIFTVENVNILLTCLGVRLLNVEDPELSGFTVKSVSLTDENLELLNVNYERKMQKDYIPVEKEEVIKPELINFDN